MGKYEPLAEFLKAQDADSVTTSFQRVEKELGFPLPKSAREYRAWWSNQKGPGHSQKEGWQAVGWETREVDLAREIVRFERIAKRETSSTVAIEELLSRAAKLSGIEDRDELLASAIEAFIQRTAGEQLIALGGSDPDAWAPDRRRP